MSVRTRSLFCLALVLGLHATITRAGAAAGDPAAATAPAETALLIEVNNPAATLAAVKASPLGQGVLASPLLTSGLTLLRSGGDFLAQYTAATSWDELGAMLPQQWAVMVFERPPDGNPEREPGVVVCGTHAQPVPAFQALLTEKLLPGFASLDAATELTGAEAQGTVLYRLQKPNEKPGMVAHTGKHLLVGNEEGVRIFLAHLSDPGRSLQQRACFQAMPEALRSGAAPLSFFANTAPTVAAVLEQLPPDSKEARDMAFLGSQYLGAVGGMATPTERGFDETVILDMGQANSQGLLGACNTRQPIPFTSPTIIPADYAVFVGLAVDRGDAFWERIKEALGAAHGQAALDKLAQGMSMLRLGFNIDFEQDLFPRLGPELFFAVKARDLEQLAQERRRPLPRDFAFIGGARVTEPGLVDFMMGRVFAAEAMVQQGWRFSTVTHGDHTLRLATPPNKPNVEIAYTMVGEFMVLASGRDVLTELIDAQKAGKTLDTKLGGSLLSAGKGVLALRAAPAPVFQTLGPALTAKAPPKARPFVQALVGLLGQLGNITVLGQPGERGPVLRSQAPLPLLSTLTALVCMDKVSKTPTERRVAVAQERMKEIAKALRKYHRQFGHGPATLTELRPGFIEQLPTDPFTQAAPFGYGLSGDGGGWILTSVGPDAKADVELEQFALRGWESLVRSQQPNLVAEAKQRIHRHRPKQYADERDPGDEGDVVMTGRW